MPAAWQSLHYIVHVDCRFVMCKLGVAICTFHAASVHKPLGFATLRDESVMGAKGHLILSALLCIAFQRRLALPYLTLPQLTSPHLTWPELTSPHLASPYLT